MRIFKKTYRDRQGQKTEASKYTVEVRGLNNLPLQLTGFTDKGLSEILGRRIEALIKHKTLNEPLPLELCKYIESAPQEIIEKLLSAGIIDQKQTQVGKPVKELVDDYIESRKSAMCSKQHLDNTKRMIEYILDAAKIRYWGDCTTQKVELILNSIIEKKMSFRCRNAYFTAFKSFHNWLLNNELISRPLPGFSQLKKLDVNLDRRHIRRSLTVDELSRLFEATKTRVIIDRQKINRGKDKGKVGAKLSDEYAAKLRLLGLERCLVYKTAYATGLRRKELASLRVKDFIAKDSILRLAAKNEKRRAGTDIALRNDLADEIKEFIRISGRKGEDSLFVVPTLRVYYADLAAAGIEKIDEDGRSADFHGLRTTLGTHLSKAGVSPRTAQEALRHSDIRLTMGIYTDPRLLDVKNALEAIPMPTSKQGGRAKIG